MQNTPWNRLRRAKGVVPLRQKCAAAQGFHKSVILGWFGLE